MAGDDLITSVLSACSRGFGPAGVVAGVQAALALAGAPAPAAAEPTPDGDRTRTNNVPDWARALLDEIVELGVRSNPATPCPAVPSNGAAASLLASSIRSAPDGVTLVTLGSTRQPRKPSSTPFRHESS